MKNSKDYLLGVLILLILWKIGSLYMGSPVILPSPGETFYALAGIITEPHSYRILGDTLLRGTVGFILALVLGVAVGIPMGLSPAFRRITQPGLVVIRSTPVISVILLALIWFTSGNVPVFVAFLMIFPVICSSVSGGIENVDKALLEMASVYKMERLTVFRWIYLPSIGSFLYPGLETASGLTWKVVIAAEVLSRPIHAIGTSMQESKIYLETASVFAWTIAALVLSGLFSFAVEFAFRQWFPGAGMPVRKAAVKE